MQDPVYTVSGRFGETSFTVRADTYEDLRSNFVTVFDGEESTAEVFLKEAAQGAFSDALDSARAVRDINASVGATTVVNEPRNVPTNSSPQPGPHNEQAVQQAAVNPPGVTYPGNCQHGQRVYRDSMARGRPWRRWECSIPWSPDVQGRCRAVNA
jgi:hypothetical protein